MFIRAKQTRGKATINWVRLLARTERSSETRSGDRECPLAAHVDDVWILCFQSCLSITWLGTVGGKGEEVAEKNQRRGAGRKSAISMVCYSYNCSTVLPAERGGWKKRENGRQLREKKRPKKRKETGGRENVTSEPGPNWRSLPTTSQQRENEARSIHRRCQTPVAPHFSAFWRLQRPQIAVSSVDIFQQFRVSSSFFQN